jgi:hypothetical protein
MAFSLLSGNRLGLLILVAGGVLFALAVLADTLSAAGGEPPPLPGPGRSTCERAVLADRPVGCGRLDERPCANLPADASGHFHDGRDHGAPAPQPDTVTRR